MTFESSTPKPTDLASQDLLEPDYGLGLSGDSTLSINSLGSLQDTYAAMKEINSTTVPSLGSVDGGPYVAITNGDHVPPGSSLDTLGQTYDTIKKFKQDTMRSLADTGLGLVKGAFSDVKGWTKDLLRDL